MDAVPPEAHAEEKLKVVKAEREPAAGTLPEAPESLKVARSRRAPARCQLFPP
jgi:hypothetical protein